MTSKRLEHGDEDNRGFGGAENVTHLKPGLEKGHKEVELGRDHRRKPAEPNKIPQESLADRMRKSRREE